MKLFGAIGAAVPSLQSAWRCHQSVKGGENPVELLRGPGLPDRVYSAGKEAGDEEAWALSLPNGSFCSSQLAVSMPEQAGMAFLECQPHKAED